MKDIVLIVFLTLNLIQIQMKEKMCQNVKMQYTVYILTFDFTRFCIRVNLT